MSKNFGLSAVEFDRLVADLRRNETAFFEQVFLHHFGDCLNYLQRTYRASRDDAYDASMDTLLLFRRRLVEGKLQYGNLRYLYTRMASQVYLRQQNRTPLTTEIQEESVVDTIPAPLADADREDQKLLGAAWDKLEAPCQELLKRFYYGKQPLSEIAAESGRTAAAIRKQKERCVKRLRDIFSHQSEIYHHE